MREEYPMTHASLPMRPPRPIDSRTRNKPVKYWLLCTRNAVVSLGCTASATGKAVIVFRHQVVGDVDSETSRRLSGRFLGLPETPTAQLRKKDNHVRDE